jgi:hypothetical protein
MAYIGKSIESGTFSVLDTSGNTYNGSNTTFNLGTQVGSVAQLLVSHDGVIQKPGTDYTLASGGTQITFTTAPASGASIFIVEISGAVGGPLDADLNGTELILDADGDTSLHASTDDQIDIKIAGADDFKFSANAMNVLSGSTLTIDSGATITNSGTANGFGAVTALNNATANELVTVGSTTTELDAEAKLKFDPPTLTIGNGTAEDVFLTFDGNAADFRIVLDDSEDGLSFGTGTSIGTSSAFCIDSQNNVTFGHTPAVGSSTPFMIRGNSAGNTGQQTSAVMNAGILFSEIRSGQTSTWAIGPDGTDFFIQNKTDDPSVNAVQINQSEVVSGDFNDTSDVALKENIVTITSSINTVKQLRPVTFDWKKTGKGETSGFIAQEVEKLIPNVVKGDNYDASNRLSIGKSINATGVLAHVTKALQEAITKIETLETEMTALKARVTTLEG